LIVLDTTILLYAVGGEDRNREPSRRVIAAITEGRLAASTSVEVIQEFTHVAARRRDRRTAARLARRYSSLLGPLLVSTAEMLEEALGLYERHRRLGAFDALLAATARAHGAEALVSADRGFSGIRGLRYVDLASPALGDLIA
jgi:hypothetical protein